MSDNTLWYTRCPIPTAFSVAVHTGLLERKLNPFGINVESIRHNASQAVRLSHFTHSLPGMIRHGGHIPPLWSRSEGRPVKLIGLSWTNEAQFVLARPDSPFETLSDLKGRRLAVPRRRNFPIDFWRATVIKGFSDALATAGLRLTDVDIVDIEIDTQPFSERGSGSVSVTAPGTAHMTLSSQRQEAFALLNGEVDAIFSPGHYGVALRAFTGARTLADLSQLTDPFAKLNNPTLLAFTVEERFLERNSDAITEVVVAALEGAELAQSNPREAGRIVAAESGNAEELVEEIFGPDFSQDLAPRLDDTILEALQRQNHFLLKNGFVSRLVPHDEWVERGPLDEARRRLVANRLPIAS